MMHVAPLAVFQCPLCSARCRGWGLHLLWVCPLAAGAALRGLRAVALGLLRAGWRLRWASTTCFSARLGCAAESTWRLHCDADLGAACLGDAVVVTWSGLLWLPRRGLVAAPLRLRLMSCFLVAADLWIRSTSVWRWETLTAGTDPAVDPLTAVAIVPLLGSILLSGRPVAGSCSLPCRPRPGPPAPRPLPVAAGWAGTSRAAPLVAPPPTPPRAAPAPPRAWRSCRPGLRSVRVAVRLASPAVLA